MKFRRLHLGLLVILAGLAAAGWWSLGSTAPAPQPATAAVTTGTVTRTVLASGMIEAKELVSVGGRVSGKVETIAVRLGQKVQAGDLIAQIESRDQENSVRQAEASLAQITAQIAAKEATLARAQSVLTRQRELGQSSYASKDAVEAATADVLVLEADLAALRAQRSSVEVTVDTAKVALARTAITSPMDGTVVAIVAKQGQTINANQSTPTIVKIADLSTMVVKADISEADVMSVQPGQTVSFTTLGAPERPFRAEVTELEPAPASIAESDTISTDQAVYYKARLEVDNEHGRLRIGMTAQVSIELGRAEDVLVIPASAVKREGRQAYVELWNAASESTERRDVRLGLNNKVMVEVREGLSSGDVVVVNGTRAGAGATAAGGASRGAGRMRPASIF